MLILKVISRLLDYPSQALFTHADDLVKAVNASGQLSTTRQDELAGFIRQLTRSDLYDAQEQYDLLFDRGRSLSLLLFEHVHGESRDRGQAMVDLMSEYSKRGFAVSAKQLPDYIPLFLEFLSEQNETYSREWLSDVSHILTILSERLLERECAYQVLFEALIELSDATVNREKIARAVQKEQPDDTLEAMDTAWEDKEIRFDQPAQPGCEQSCGNLSAMPGTSVTRHQASDISAV
ncbi:MAG: nitrate reductase molybdenum cofactor assembly chaperone [bacterium]|nr:nitrate reductase molybdenum cofactor assembly chaperone [bacterium]